MATSLEINIDDDLTSFTVENNAVAAFVALEMMEHEKETEQLAVSTNNSFVFNTQNDTELLQNEDHPVENTHDCSENTDIRRTTFDDNDINCSNQEELETKCDSTVESSVMESHSEYKLPDYTGENDNGDMSVLDEVNNNSSTSETEDENPPQSMCMTETIHSGHIPDKIENMDDSSASPDCNNDDSLVDTKESHSCQAMTQTQDSTTTVNTTEHEQQACPQQASVAYEEYPVVDISADGNTVYVPRDVLIKSDDGLSAKEYIDYVKQTSEMTIPTTEDETFPQTMMNADEVLSQPVDGYLAQDINAEQVALMSANYYNQNTVYSTFDPTTQQQINYAVPTNDVTYVQYANVEESVYVDANGAVIPNTYQQPVMYVQNATEQPVYYVDNGQQMCLSQNDEGQMMTYSYDPSSQPMYMQPEQTVDGFPTFGQEEQVVAYTSDETGENSTQAKPEETTTSMDTTDDIHMSEPVGNELPTNQLYASPSGELFSVALPGPQAEVEQTSSYGPEGGDQELQFPSLHISDSGIITILLRHDIAVEMTADRSLRVVNRPKKMVLATNGRGTSCCVIHPAVRVSQVQTTTDVDLYLLRKAKMTTEYITFGNNFKTYKFDYNTIHEDNSPEFEDLSIDDSVNFLNNSDVDIETARQTCASLVSEAFFEKFNSYGFKVTINGVKVVQNGRGDVTVYQGPKYFRMSPSRCILRAQTHFMEMDVEANWNVKLRRGTHTLNASHLGYVMCNGKLEAALDSRNRLSAVTLPGRIPMLTGQRRQRRPGVNHRRWYPAWRPIVCEPENDHKSYTRRNNDE